ncbi:MAG: aminoacyl-tRNA hydrolase [Thermoleophilia bacterium]
MQFRGRNIRRRRNPNRLFLVVGLGNPGEEYRRSRHNAGFMTAERVRRDHDLPRPRGRYQGRYCEGSVGSHDTAVLFPLTYMNLSGEAVAEAAQRKHVPAGDIIVIHDDLDFPFGVVRVRQGGGDGGHNGLKSIIARLGSPDFIRVRVGIGRPEGPGTEASEYVLAPFSEAEDEVEAVMAEAAACVEAIIVYGAEAAMARCNRREKTPGTS